MDFYCKDNARVCWYHSIIQYPCTWTHPLVLFAASCHMCSKFPCINLITGSMKTILSWQLYMPVDQYTK